MTSRLDAPEGNDSTVDTAEDLETDVMTSEINDGIKPTDHLNPAVALDNESQSNSHIQSNTSKGMFENLPDINCPDWYSHKSFDRYWNHYKYVMNWYGKHREVYKSLERRSQPRPSFHQPMFSYPYPSANVPLYRQDHFGHAPLGRGRSSKRGKRNVHDSPRGRGRKPQPGTNVDVESDMGQTPSESAESVHTNMEISEEMLDFFAKSHKHRKQRDAEKKAETEKMNEDKRINIEEVKGQPRERTTEAPKERPGSRRTTEMKLLYGKGAAMIHGMETALQMTYNRNFDAKQPKNWPNMPFRCVFTNL